jgi:hypothetical protein
MSRTILIVEGSHVDRTRLEKQPATKPFTDERFPSQVRAL